MKVTVIIPTSGRAKKLKVALESICSNNLEHVAEILVIENGVKDGSELVVSQIVAAFGANKIQYHYTNVPGLLSGRHLGIERASGELLCFLDDDVELSKGYLENVHSIFSENESLRLATGPSLPVFESEPPTWFTFLWTIIPEGKFCIWLSLLDFGNKSVKIDPTFVWGLNFCIRKSAAIQFGGFHPDSVPNTLSQYQGDGETALTAKASAHNAKAMYFPELSLCHHISNERLTIEYLKQRFFLNGIGNSFGQLRAFHLNPSKFSSTIQKRNWRDVLLPYYRWLRNFYLQPKTVEPPPEIKTLLNNLKRSEQEGFDFHQHQFKNDPKVREWVLRENYWDYRLPED